MLLIVQYIFYELSSTVVGSLLFEVQSLQAIVISARDNQSAVFVNLS